MMMDEEISIWGAGMDFFLGCLGYTITFFMMTYAKPSKTGFFCDDDTIRFPYKSSVVSTRNLYLFATFFPVHIMAAVEVWLLRRGSERRRPHGSFLRVLLRVVLRLSLRFASGLGCLEMLTITAKFTVGRLRPNFLAVCRPSVLCNDTGIDLHAYITDYECTGSAGSAMHHVSFSFPSGHSAVSFFAAIYTVMYLEQRIRWPERAVVVKTAVEVAMVVAAWFMALSRITDHTHHWSDVLVGGALGTTIACFWVLRVLRVPRYDLRQRLKGTVVDSAVGDVDNGDCDF